jgi:tetratricopeptide (TPR) repeat protein
VLINYETSLKVSWKSHTKMNKLISDLNEASLQAYQHKKYEDALTGFQSCIEQLIKKGSSALDIAEVKNNLSVTFLAQKEYQKAYDSVFGTEQVFSEYGDKKKQAMALGNIGTALQSLGRMDEALVNFEQSADLFKDVNEPELRSYTLKKIADIQIKTKKQFQALASIQAAYDQKEKKSVKDNVLKTVVDGIINRITRR